MSGGHRFPYPKYVWSPAGGWWASPVNWKRNTLIYIGFMAVTCAFAANSAQSKTVAYYPREPPKAEAHH